MTFFVICSTCCFAASELHSIVCMQDLVTELVDQGIDVVIVADSYGRQPIGKLPERLGKKDGGQTLTAGKAKQ